jgi:hypothetical protein
MIQIFDKLEEPFVLYDPQRQRHDRRKSHRDDWSGEDHEHDAHDGIGAEFYDTEYKPIGLYQRWKWITSKTSCQELLSGIERLQMRRVAMQTTELMM